MELQKAVDLAFNCAGKKKWMGPCEFKPGYTWFLLFIDFFFHPRRKTTSIYFAAHQTSSEKVLL